MRLLIIGAGETGNHIAQELSEEHLDVTLVDENPIHLANSQKELNVACVRGNGTSLTVLERAGIAETDVVIAATDQDETNLICCLLAGLYGVKTKIAVTKTESFVKRNLIAKYLESGISEIINSSIVASKEILDLAAFASAAEVSAFGEKNVMLIGYNMRQESHLVNRPLNELRGGAQKRDFLIASIVRDGESFIPSGRDTLKAGDYIYILVLKEKMESLNEFLQVKVALSRRAVVAGGGHVAAREGAGLLKSHYDVTQIVGEGEPLEIKKQVHGNPHFQMVSGEADSVKLQLELDVPVCALFIAVTQSDPLNLAAALCAKYLKAKKTIALVNREDIARVARVSGIDGVISPRLSTARKVRKALYGGQGELNFTTISETHMEVHEMVAGEGAPILGMPLKNLRLPAGSLVGALLRGGNQAIIADGETVIEAGNQVVMLTLPEGVPRLKELIEGKKTGTDRLPPRSGLD